MPVAQRKAHDDTLLTFGVVTNDLFFKIGVAQKEKHEALHRCLKASEGSSKLASPADSSSWKPSPSSDLRSVCYSTAFPSELLQPIRGFKKLLIRNIDPRMSNS